MTPEHLVEQPADRHHEKRNGDPPAPDHRMIPASHNATTNGFGLTP
jgi:hypothetical protein